MNWEELLSLTQLGVITVTIIKPVRKPPYEGSDVFTKGKLTGFKSGIIGGAHYNYRKEKEQRTMSHSYDSRRLRYLKPPKVQVTYDMFQFGKSEISDWIDVSNCKFEILNNPQTNEIH